MTENEDQPRYQYNSRIRLGILIIAPAFILIAFMVYMQYSASIQTMDALNKLVNEGDPQKITAVANAFDGINASNQSFFNILLAVFAAWVGAVVAFYFGSENLQQAQQTLRTVINAKQELANKTIEKLLTELKDARDIKKSKLNDNISVVRKELQTMSNVLVIDDKEKPLGILYRVDLEKYGKIVIDEPHEMDYDKKPLSEFTTKITADYITKKSWKEDGILNYAALSLTDNLLQAKNKMEVISGSTERLLSVRGLVIDKGIVIAIINFENLTKGII